jgi:hypothetical protein
MTDEQKENSGLGREIMFEWLHSTFAKEHSEAEKRRSAEEDEKDTAKRVALVMAANSAAPFPIRREKFDHSSDVMGRTSRTTRSICIPSIFSAIRIKLNGSPT